MRRIESEKNHYGCTMDDVKAAIAKGAMPKARAELVSDDGSTPRAKMVVSDYLYKFEMADNGIDKMEWYWWFDYDQKNAIMEYLEEDYEGGFHV